MTIDLPTYTGEALSAMVALDPIESVSADLWGWVPMWMSQESTQKAMDWYRVDTTTPVLLAFSISHQSQEHVIPLLNPFPLPHIGEYAILDKGDGENVVCYHIHDLPPEARQRWRALGEAIHKLSAPLFWPAFTEQHTIASDRNEYQRTINDLETRRMLLPYGDLRFHTLAKIAYHESAQLQLWQLREMLKRETCKAQWEEVQRMACSVAGAYREWHGNQIKPPAALFPLEGDKPTKKQRPQSAATFDASGYAPIVACLPMQGVLNAISNAASGGNRWVFDEESSDYRDPPYFTQTWKSGNKSTIIYKPDESMAVPDNKISRQLWDEVKQIDESMADIVLDIISHLSRNLDEDGAAWFFTSDHLDNRSLVKITKDKDTIKERTAGHRTEKKQAISTTLNKLQNIWLTIHQFIEDENEGKGRKKKRKKRLYTHTGRFLMVDSYWYQNELTGEETDLKPSDAGYAIGWHIRPGEWLKTFLETPNRQVARLCKTLIEYDPYHQRHEKRIGRYILFHGHMHTRGKAGTLTRLIQGILAEISLLPEEELPRNAQRIRDRFEKAMNQLAEDHVINGWRYDTENKSLPAKNWLPTWLNWQVQIFIAPAYKRVETEGER